MIAAGVTWPIVALSALIFVVICFLAVLWSKREWNTRRIRVGVFMDREYKTENGEDEQQASDS